MIFNYFARKLPGPGVGNLAFVSGFGDPLYSLVGTGMLPQRQLTITEGGTLARPTVLLQELGGIVGGQLALQGLIAPRRGG